MVRRRGGLCEPLLLFRFLLAKIQRRQFRGGRITPMNTYCHAQRAPLCFLLYAIAIVLFVVAWFFRTVPPFPYLYPPLGVLMLVLAASFHHLTVKDQGERLSITFGPIALFRRSVKYEDVADAEIGRTTILDGWGIHKSLRGGWVWNLWGRDCVAIRFKNGGILRVGTDDVDNLARFIAQKIRHD